MLDWEDLRSFLAVARAGTLSGAARSLGIRQSTMGRRLAAFEARAGVLLLQKTPRGYVLTSAGEAALAEAEKMETAALAAERAITGQDTRLAGEVRLTTIETLAAEVLMPILAQFAADYPGILVKLISSQRTLSLAAREADLAVRMARPLGGDLVIRKLGDIGYGYYTSPAYLARHGVPTPGGAGHRVILMEDDAPNFPEYVAMAQYFAEAEVGFRSDSRYVQLQACKAGLGVACLAHYLAAPQGLARLPGCDANREVWLVQHRDTKETPRFKALSAALVNGMKAQNALLAG